MHIQKSSPKLLVLCVLLLNLDYSHGKSENIGWSSKPYWSASVRNYNSGACYYMRHATATTTDTFGYSFYRNRSFYHSGYGYRMYYPPTYYTPVYMGDSYYFYYPPMFYYYYYFGFNNTYWDGRRPRYLCRNDNAFWPLENQTSEFVGGRVPSLDLSTFDQNLSLPMDDPYSSNFLSNFQLGFVRMRTGWTELNSWALNQNPSADSDMNPIDFSRTTDRLWTLQTAMHSPPSEPHGRAILAYNYFACPDGKDPNEIYCCGSDTAQYCCRELVRTISWDAVVAVNMLTLVGIVAILVAVKYLSRCCDARRATPVPSTPYADDTDVNVHVQCATQCFQKSDRSAPVHKTIVVLSKPRHSSGIPLT